MAPQVDARLTRFGNTDLYVSRLCQGTAFRQLTRSPDDTTGQAILRRCLDLGVNFFDSARSYGWGGSEQALARAIAGRRGEVVICTKVGPNRWPAGADTAAEDALFTRDFIFETAEASLRRLQTDYVDLYLLHKPDGHTPAEEIVDTMDALVRSGRARYWGVSNHPAALVDELLEAARRLGKTLPVGTEDYFNLAGRDRRVEEDLFPLVRREGLGLMAYSPMATGFLAPGRTADPGTPLASLLVALERVVQDLGATRAQVCIAWVLSHPEVTSVLAGAEAPEHVDENLTGTRLVLPPDALVALNAASDAYRSATVAG